MLNVAMVGCGGVAKAHMEGYRNLPEGLAKLTAVVGRNEETGKAMAEKAGCAYYRTLEEAVAGEDIHVVDVCVPTFLHEEYVIKAANLGKHVLCEKPVTFTLESFDAMYGACRKNGVKFMVGQVLRFTPAFAEVSRIVRSGKLGQLHMSATKRYSQAPAWTTWHKYPERSGGSLYDLNVHDIDFQYSMFGMPCTVYAVGWKTELGCWDHTVTTLTWPDGHHAVVDASLHMIGDVPFMAETCVNGEGGTVQYMQIAENTGSLSSSYSELSYYPVGEDAQKPELDTGDPFVYELTGFLQAIRDDTEVPIPPEQSRQVLQIVLASKKSLEEGVVVQL